MTDGVNHRSVDLQARLDAAGEKAKLETRAIFANLNTIEQVITKPRLERERLAAEAKVAEAETAARVAATPRKTTSSVLDNAALAIQFVTEATADIPDGVLTTEAGAIARLVQQIQSS